MRFNRLALCFVGAAFAALIAEAGARRRAQSLKSENDALRCLANAVWLGRQAPEGPVRKVSA